MIVNAISIDEEPLLMIFSYNDSFSTAVQSYISWEESDVKFDLKTDLNQTGKYASDFPHINSAGILFVAISMLNTFTKFEEITLFKFILSFLPKSNHV